MIHRIVIAIFSLQDKNGKDRFLEESFLVTDTSKEVILGISFFYLSNIDFRFVEIELE